MFQLDITRLRCEGQKLYPTMLYHIAGEVNRWKEFRRLYGIGEGEITTQY